MPCLTVPHKEIASQKKLDKQSGIEPIYMQGKYIEL